ncbi:MAG: FAD-dependent oxidoreductase [Candidatus Bathyarchaeota archaeon]|nr:FAD-dependent oxidoreductase [Candidatus Bathyarchaeota archaeon]
MSLQVASSPSMGFDEVYDAVVVGAGPAGLAAAIYLARSNAKSLVLEADKPGGKLNVMNLIDNYPGFPSTSGIELSRRIVEHADSVGVRIVSPARVVGFEFHEERKILRTRQREYFGRNVLLAMGVQRKKLGVPGVNELLGRGVSYCAICDGSFFKGRDIALVGNDEETLAEGLYLSGLARKVYLISGLEPTKFQQNSLERLLSTANVEHLAKHKVTEIVGSSAVERIRVQRIDGETSELNVQGVFVAGEMMPMSDLLANVGLKTDSSGCIEVDGGMRSNLPGVYAAGDIACGRKFQVAVSVGQGAIAALSMIRDHAQARRRERF